MFAAPLDWIFQYAGRPKAVITKSEYIDRARGLAMRAKEIKVWLDDGEVPGQELYLLHSGGSVLPFVCQIQKTTGKLAGVFSRAL